MSKSERKSLVSNANGNKNKDTSKDAAHHDAGDETKHNRKKRLSRKEQKARKKRKKDKDAACCEPISNSDDASKAISDATDEHANNGSNSKSSNDTNKGKKKERNKKHKKDNNTTSEATPRPHPMMVEHNFDDSHVPIAVPAIDSNTSKAKGKSLGKWFPSAKVIKCRPAAPVTQSSSSTTSSENEDGKGGNRKAQAALVLFYQYASPKWSEAKVEQLMAYIAKLSEHRQLGGRIRVAPEGVNVTLSSIDDGDVSALQTLHHFAKDLKHFDANVFEHTHFKYIPQLDASRHFTNLKILPIKELVYYGLGDEDAPLDKRGVHLHPKDFHSMLQGDKNEDDKKETIVVDVRNHYEAAIGRFDGQELVAAQRSPNKGGKKKNASNDSSAAAAEYVDPKMRKSTDFPTWLEKPETQQKLKGKHVLLYCTGGVRCERASAHLNSKLGDKVKGVYQLEGGIEHYLQHYPDGGYWRGKNFVFDKREAFDAQNWNGDGGVIRKQAKKQVDKKNNKKSSSHGESSCCICNTPWDRYVGKKKCDTCGVPVLMCDSCMSKHGAITKQKRKKKQGMRTNTAGDGNHDDDARFDLIRCPLCKEENVTTKVDDVEYTNNGVTAIHKKKDNDNGNGHGKKAATSVLKWGGGHAAQKKEKRRFQRKLCRFGVECVRDDCFFAHPERQK